jgi:hypothetical protein
VNIARQYLRSRQFQISNRDTGEKSLYHVSSTSQSLLRIDKFFVARSCMLLPVSCTPAGVFNHDIGYDPITKRKYKICIFTMRLSSVMPYFDFPSALINTCTVISWHDTKTRSMYHLFPTCLSRLSNLIPQRPPTSWNRILSLAIPRSQLYSCNTVANCGGAEQYR